MMKYILVLLVLGVIANQTIADRAEQWLDAHNFERELYHEEFGRTFVPLSWSTGLEFEAREFARHIVEDCRIHTSSDIPYGQNIFILTGRRRIHSTDNIVAFWMGGIDEGDLNANAQQILWRATKFLGCADAQSRVSNDEECSAAVCFYVKPGNCNVRKSKRQRMHKMLADDSLCVPFCPPDYEDCESE